MDCETELRKSRWTLERVARLGFLIGSGWDQERIASDPIISCKPRSVQRQANRYGLAFSDVSETFSMRLNSRQSAPFDKAARKRGITREYLIRLLLIEMIAEPNLIDNILDDGE